MKLKGKLAADMIFHGAKRYGETGTKMAKATLQIKVREEEAADTFGADFHRVAFGGMQVSDGLASFPCDVMTKPNLTVEVHGLEMFGEKLRVSPEVPKITPCEEEPAVTLTVVLPLEVTNLRKEFFGELTCSSGDMVECEFDPVQMDLPGTEDPGMRVVHKDGGFGNPQPQLVEG